MDTPAADRDALDALRADLTAAPFTVDDVGAMLGHVAAGALQREQTVPALRAATTDSPTGTLTRVFLLGAPVPARALAAALPRLGVGGAERLGLVRAAGRDDDDPVRAAVDLRPYAATDSAGTAHWWLASDLGEAATGRSLRADHVLGVGGASTTLLAATIREPRRRALDLGTGCGIQALHAARHCEAVVGTDTSARALAFARFNAALAGTAVDWRQGSLLEPVDGEVFDLVVSNPPFVITPHTGVVPDYTYRDAGRAGDALVEELVTGLGAVLAPGGVAQLLGNWEQRAGEDWRDRVGTWLDRSGLDGWVVQREVLDPAHYAETWLRDGGMTPDRDPAGWARAYEAWLDDFARRDVEAIGFGMVVLRRPERGGPTLRRIEERLEPIDGPLGEHLGAVLAAHDWLAGRDDDAVLAEVLMAAPDVTEERYLVPGAADPTTILLRQGGGFGRSVRAGTALAALVGACDGGLTVGQIVGALGALLGRTVRDVAAEVLPDVRGLVLDGLLLPTSGRRGS